MRAPLQHSLWLCLGVAGLACVPAAHSAPASEAPAVQDPANPTLTAKASSNPEAPSTEAPPAKAPPAKAPPAEAPPAETPPAETPFAAKSMNGPRECVEPPGPQMKKESPWTRETLARVQQLLPITRRCTRALPPGEEEQVTLRLVFDQDGQPLSQHVVHARSGACAVTECLKEALAQVRSPKAETDPASIDVGLVLTRGAEARGALEAPHALLTDEALAHDPESCIDPEVARLSQAKVREVMSGSYAALNACYGQALSRSRSVAGDVTFELVIGREGKVALARARDATLDDCEAIHCMLDQLRALTFPPPVGRSVRIIYPISYVVEKPPPKLQ